MPISAVLDEEMITAPPRRHSTCLSAGAVLRYTVRVCPGVANSGTATPLDGCPARVAHLAIRIASNDRIQRPHAFHRTYRGWSE